jgi:DNA-binding NtrC family response regulator
VRDREISILAIDDDEVILQSISRQLRNENVTLDLEQNPITGLERAAEKRYDLVLCDIKMKPINGIEVLRQLKERDPGLPVVILSAFIDDQLFEEAKRLGSYDFLIKPVRRHKLTSTIFRALQQENDG